MGIAEIDVLDKGYFFEDITGLVAYSVQTAIDNRQRKRSTMLKEQHRGHREQFVDFAGDLRQLGAIVTATVQPEC